MIVGSFLIRHIHPIATHLPTIEVCKFFMEGIRGDIEGVHNPKQSSSNGVTNPLNKYIKAW